MNICRITFSTKTIPLTNGHEAIVDVDDYEELIKHKWHTKYADKQSPPYAARSVRIGAKVKTIRMHRQIMNCPPGKDVDHQNKNRLDNRKCNLEIVSKQKNAARRWGKTG